MVSEKKMFENILEILIEYIICLYKYFESNFLGITSLQINRLLVMSFINIFKCEKEVIIQFRKLLHFKMFDS